MAGRRKHMIRNHRSCRRYQDGRKPPVFLQIVVPEVDNRNLYERIVEALNNVVAGAQEFAHKVTETLSRIGEQNNGSK